MEHLLDSKMSESTKQQVRDSELVRVLTRMAKEIRDLKERVKRLEEKKR